jgi:hypothetical protein
VDPHDTTTERGKCKAIVSGVCHKYTLHARTSTVREVCEGEIRNNQVTCVTFACCLRDFQKWVRSNRARPTEPRFALRKTKTTVLRTPTSIWLLGTRPKEAYLLPLLISRRRQCRVEQQQQGTNHDQPSSPTIL